MDETAKVVCVCCMFDVAFDIVLLHKHNVLVNDPPFTVLMGIINHTFYKVNNSQEESE